VTVLRRWILPIAWFAVFVVIAAALVRIAFFADEEAAEGAEGAVPTGDFSEPQVAVERGTVRNDLTLKASVLSDPATDVLAAKTGNVIDVFVQVGAAVEEGQVLASVREDLEGDDGETIALWSEIVAPSTGTLSAFDVRSGLAVAPGDEVGAVAPASFRVQGSIEPVDRYRLETEPTEAEVAITNGPEPFVCTDLVLETPLPAGGDEEQAAGDGETSITTTVRCSVPGDVRVFPGLAAEMTIAGGLAEDVLTVPATAVLGAAGTGTVFVPGDDGSPVEREVELGLSDGTSVEVVSGLEEGESVFEYVPGSSLEQLEEECTELPDGGMECYAVPSDEG